MVFDGVVQNWMKYMVLAYKDKTVLRSVMKSYNAWKTE